jgi:phosphoribosyl 1,2-cyclic phosphate phosphodiesterase
MRVTILGCGGSGGVPLIGGFWGACKPENPRNRRLRSSILVEEGDTRILVDSSPDLRQQMLALGGDGRLDAVLYTHAHADHLHGIDDLRVVNAIRKAPLDLYAAPETLEKIRTRFGYVLPPLAEGKRMPNPQGFFYKPVLTAHAITGPFRVGAIDVLPFEQDHGFVKTLGFRFGRAAYSTDVVELGEGAFAALEGVSLWIVDALRLAPHDTHSHLEKTLGWIARVKPARAVLTHMNFEMDYDDVAARCPPGVEPGYDGLAIEV